MARLRARRDEHTSPVAALRRDPDFGSRRCWRQALKVGVALGMPFGVVPAALLLELAPQLGFLRPAAVSFATSVLVFTGLARAPHRAVVWIAAGSGSALLILFAVGTTAWTLTQSLGDVLG